MTDDYALLTAWHDGDLQAADALVRRHVPHLYRFFRSKVSGNVADLVQNTLAACAKRATGARFEGSFKAFVLGVARNQLRLFFRDRGYEQRLFADGLVSAQDAGPSPISVLAGQQEERLLLSALRRLPLDLQILVELYYWEDLKVADVAHVLGAPAGTIKSRLSRARALLKQGVAEAAESDALCRSTTDHLDKWAASLRDKLHDPGVADRMKGDASAPGRATISVRRGSAGAAIRRAAARRRANRAPGSAPPGAWDRG